MSQEQSAKTISGFSKLSKRGKIKWLVENFFKDPESVVHELKRYVLSNEADQKIIDEISENTISNFHLPYGVAPNFLIDGRAYAIPMVIEESSVVAAASSSAKFWLNRGGFKTRILSTNKVGQVHLNIVGDTVALYESIEELNAFMKEACADITKNMNARGGGILDMQLVDLSEQLDHYHQLRIRFETCDSMGANFINSCLERIAERFPDFLASRPNLNLSEDQVEVVMSILSNYTPECVVRAEVSCAIEDLGSFGEMNAQTFAERFKRAVDIALTDTYRAVTHNKGIYNGIDAVILATGNDFRAIEAAGHAYAARDGVYKSLSSCTIDQDIFTFSLEVPLAVGTVGGLTGLHPIAKRSLELLGHPSAATLMSIVAATGLAQNFAALRSLVTTGIQKGHMKMHLMNVLRQLGATECQKTSAKQYFENKVVTHSSVRDFLKSNH